MSQSLFKQFQQNPNIFFGFYWKFKKCIEKKRGRVRVIGFGASTTCKNLWEANSKVAAGKLRVRTVW